MTASNGYVGGGGASREGKEKGEIKRWIVNLVTGSAYGREPVHLLLSLREKGKSVCFSCLQDAFQVFVSLQRLGRRVNSQITGA
jgi:hypothetical protein